MNSVFKWLAAGLLAAAAAGAATPDEGFERYRVILERKPFGDLPPPPGSGQAAPTPQQPTFAQSFGLSEFDSVSCSNFSSVARYG